MENSIFFSIFCRKFDIFVTKFYHLFVMLMNLIGFVIENLSYNWSIITYRNSNTNAVGVFHCIKIIYGTFHLEGTCDLEGLCFCWISISHIDRINNHVARKTRPKSEWKSFFSVRCFCDDSTRPR